MANSPAGAPNYAPNTVNQTVDYGGITWKGQPGQGWTAQSQSGGGNLPGQAPSFQQTLQNAQSLNTAQIAANAPAITTLQSTNTDLQTRYKDLIASINTAGQTALNTQTQSGLMGLGARGIDVNSQMGQNMLAQVQAPVTSQTQQNISAAQAQESQASIPIQQQISQLQAGNLPMAVTAATGYSTADIQAASNMYAAMTGAQAQEQAAQTQANAIVQAQQIQSQNQPLNYNQTYFNPTTGQFVNPSQYFGGNKNYYGQVPVG